MPKSENPCVKIFLLIILFFTMLKLPKMLNCNNNMNHRGGNRIKYNVYGYMGCPYTVKQVNEFKKNNVNFKFIDTNTQQGSKQFSQVNDGENGVPLTIDVSTGKKYHGFTDISRM